MLSQRGAPGPRPSGQGPSEAEPQPASTVAAVDWTAVYEAFPINQRYTWLNNAGTTPAGRHVLEHMQRYLQSYAEIGPKAIQPAQLLSTINGHLSTLLGCAPEEIAVVHNTAEGMNTISHGITLQPGDEILLLENEYPSNVYPWEHWRGRGVQLRFVPLAPTWEEFLSGMRSCLTSRARVLSLSAVHWCTGMPLPLEAVARLCHERGVFLVVDGAQGVGQIPIRLDELGPCALCFSAWKWLLGPVGVGVLVIHRSLFDQVVPVFKGPETVVQGASWLPYQTEYRATAERYTCSTPNLNDWVYFAASLEFLSSIGFKLVQARIHQLADMLRQGLVQLGFRSAYDRTAAPSSGIVSVERPGTDSASLARTLCQQGIIACERLGQLRLAPHVYLLPEQLGRTLEVIARA